MVRRRLLGALPDHRRGSAARRGGNRIRQFVTGDGERALLFGSVPLGEQRGLDLEGEGLVRRVDGDGAKVGDAPLDDGLVFLGSRRCAVARGYLGKIGTRDDEHIAAVDIHGAQSALRADSSTFTP